MRHSMNPIVAADIVLAAILVAAPSGAIAQNTPAQAPAEARDEATPQATPPVSDQFGQAVREVFERIWVPRSRFTNSPHVRKAFRPVIDQARQGTVQVLIDGSRVALGGVVDPDGWVLTKASLARGPIVCRLGDGREFPAKVTSVDRENDLAILKIEANGLDALDLDAGEESHSTVSLRPGDDPDQPSDPNRRIAIDTTPLAGDWVATVGAGRDPVAVGVVSVAPRRIEKRPGLLGISMDLQYRGGGAKVDFVRKKSAAETAGVVVGDVITEADGVRIDSPESLKRLIGEDRNPGDIIRLSLLREGESLVVNATLTSWDPHPVERRAYYQNNLGGELSERRFGFESALQHDTVLDPSDCGGPIVDLDGQVVGFNISRAGRTESYAIPVALVREKLDRLLSERQDTKPDGTAAAAAEEGS